MMIRNVIFDGGPVMAITALRLKVRVESLENRVKRLELGCNRVMGL